MRVHHLNCGTMRPGSKKLINGEGGLFARGEMVCHCLLIETGSDGLILVDTGIGRAAVERPGEILGRSFTASTRPALRTEETAHAQVLARGFDPAEVRHIVVTHLDLDHAGGLADFPQAQVHVHAPEHAAATNPGTALEKSRYRAVEWSHGPDWRLHDLAAGGDDWFGFASVRELPGGLVLIPLYGHTRGHVGVAVDTGDGWLLHAGDSYFFHGEVDPVKPHSTPGLRLFQTVVQVDGKARHANQRRLHELAAAHGKEVTIFSAHDPKEFRALASG
ncbi:MBL fold metallo-hydrolase [Actinocorallia longicatena]|uniref:MBL fold metallo-hydrolase n=1 Tax=Actinocorallia longicatena TaxID=111803 RepID=A0ABP6QJ83_9ACTN